MYKLKEKKIKYQYNNKNNHYLNQCLLHNNKKHNLIS